MSLQSTLGRWLGILSRGPRSREADETRAIEPESRATTYSINQAMYDNVAYTAWCSQILSTYFPTCPPNDLIRGYYNPVKQIVDVYQNCLPGTFGAEITIDPMIDEQPVNPKLAGPVRRVWRDSNLDTEKNVIQRYAANLGTVGLRAHVRNGRVMVQYDHPSRLFHVEEDGEGNVLAAVLKYQVSRKENESTLTKPSYEQVDVVEIFTKDEFSQTIDGKEQIPDEARDNQYGFCPYVILRHRDNGTWLGDHAYKGAEPIIHAINYRITQQDRSVGRLMFPKWFLAAGGDKPTSIDVGGEKAWYVKLMDGASKPLAQAIVPQVNIKDAQGFWLEQINLLRLRNPEVALNDLALYANISGETVAQVLKQVEFAVLNVRPSYDHALIRVIQMCLSLGMSSGLSQYDVGSGATLESGDRAYKEGKEAFAFAPRSALPLTPAQQEALAKAGVADRAARYAVAKQAQALGVSEDEVFRQAGFTDEQIKTMRQERREIDVVPSEDL